MTFGELKKLEFPEGIPMNVVLTHLLYEQSISVKDILISYEDAIRYKLYASECKFTEATCNILQLLSGTFNKEIATKRAIHTYNMSNKFPKNAFNQQYNYTEEDAKKWDDFYEKTYGHNPNE